MLYETYSTSQVEILNYVSKPESYPYVTEYPTQTNLTGPNGIAADERGNVWFLLWNQNSLAELIPSNSTIREFRLPTSNNTGLTGYGMTIDNSRNLVWFTNDATNSIWEFSITNSKFTNYAIPQSNAQPYGIALDRQGNVWFTEGFADRIGEIVNGKINESTTIPTNVSYAFPNSLVVDSKSQVWFTLTNANAIGKFYEGRFTLYNLTGSSINPDLRAPVGIAMDSSGNIWVTQHGPNFVSEFNPQTGYFRTIATSTPHLTDLNLSLPYFIQIAQSGDVWFNEHYGNAMAEFVPSTETLIEYAGPSEIRAEGNTSGMLTMALAPNGEPWFTELFTGKVGTVNTSEPLPLALSFANSSLPDSPISIPNGSSYFIQLSVVNQGSSSVDLVASIGNYTDNADFSFSFTPGNGSSTFSSSLMIRNNHSASGVVFVTISAKIKDLTVSRIIEVEVP